MFNEFYVEQTLHGYSNGHRLLKSSCKLSDKDNKKMITLSDLSGNEFVSGFEKYYTGYSLDSNRIVLACTWYAEEMKRPGCVWTHSLIMNKKDLNGDKSCVNALIGLFKKPNVDNELQNYDEPLRVTSSGDVLLDADKLRYLIWCLWGNQPPLVAFDDSAKGFEKELLFIFLTQHDLLKNNFSFCTGSVSLRGYEGDVLHFQIAPRKTSRSKMLIGEGVYEAKEISIIRSYPLWVNKIYDNIMKDSMKDFKKFIRVFPDDFNNAYYVSSFMKLYVGANVDIKDTNIVKLLEMASAIFEAKKVLGDAIVCLYDAGNFKHWCGKENYTKALSFFVNNMWLNKSFINHDFWIRHCYNDDFNGAKRIFRDILCNDEEYDIEPYLKSYANIISIDSFAEFTEMDFESCCTLISIKNELAKCKEIWRQNKAFQQSVISSTTKTDDKFIIELVETVLVNSQYNLVSDLYNAYGKVCVPIFWEYLLTNYHDEKSNSIINIVRNDMNEVVQKLISKRNNRESILLLIDMVDPYDEAIKQLQEEDVLNIYRIVRDNACTEKEKETLAKFLLPICIVEDYMVDVEIAKFSFEIVHDLLATQSYPEDEWYKLEKILPEVAYYNNWDRCKRLRKGFRKKGYSFIKKKDKNKKV